MNGRVDLDLAHLTSKAHDHAIGGPPRIVDPCLICNERLRPATQVDEVRPVGAVAGQPRELQTDHDPHLATAHRGHHLSEGGPSLGCRSRTALVLVEHANAFFRPAELHRPFHQVVLPSAALAVVFHLVGRGLSHVKARPALEVLGEIPRVSLIRRDVLVVLVAGVGL